MISTFFTGHHSWRTFYSDYMLRLRLMVVIVMCDSLVPLMLLSRAWQRRIAHKHAAIFVKSNFYAIRNMYSLWSTIVFILAPEIHAIWHSSQHLCKQRNLALIAKHTSLLVTFLCIFFSALALSRAHNFSMKFNIIMQAPFIQTLAATMTYRWYFEYQYFVYQVMFLPVCTAIITMAEIKKQVRR